MNKLLMTAAMVVVAGLVSPAQAIERENGIRLNGIHWNGFQHNGIHWNGFKHNGIHWNGMVLQGIKLNGMVQGVEWNGLQLNGHGIGMAAPAPDLESIPLNSVHVVLPTR